MSLVPLNDIETLVEDKQDLQNGKDSNSRLDESVYSYTQRNEFTSEIFKVEVRNLGIFGIAEFKKLLRNHAKVEPCKIKSPKRRGMAYICFRNEVDRDKAITFLDGFLWKGKIIKANIAKAVPDPLVKRRLETTDENKDIEIKKSKTCVEATCPLYNITYEEQLEYKKGQIENVLIEFGKQIYKINPLIKGLSKNDLKNIPFSFDEIKPSPKIEGYRNKSEFAIGKNSQGDIVVGFRLGTYADGSTEVGAIDDLPHLPLIMKKAAKVFEKYLKQSKFQIFNPEHNVGHFRQLSVRTTELNDDIMLIVGVYSINLSSDEIIELKKEVTEFFDNYDKTDFICTSLYYQDLKRKKSGEQFNSVDHLSGNEYIFSKLHDLTFRISPLAFFQINTSAAELLYQEIINIANPKPNSIVLDICCGTGTIGICFSRYCKQVYGVELIADAIKDAEYNTTLNSIKNCTFYAGNTNEYISNLVHQACNNDVSDTDTKDIIAIVDPPRPGLHHRSILAIRNAKELKRLVYVSCSPKNALQNWIGLCRPTSKTYKGLPFYPKTAIAVDMFPHTAHTELILLFERMDTNLNIAESKNETESQQ